MHLIIGGAYQGKLDFAKAMYGFSDADVFFCTKDAPVDFSRPCIANIEEFVYGCAERGEAPTGCFHAQRALYKDSVLLCRDIHSGIVPVSSVDRAWREQTGALLKYLAEHADRVSRIYLGLEQRLK